MTDDLMTRARQAIASEDAERLADKARQINETDEQARVAEEAQRRRDDAIDAAARALAAEGISLPALGAKFNAAVAALADLAEAATIREQVIRDQATALLAVGAADLTGRTAEYVEISGQRFAVADNKPAVLVARACAVAASALELDANGTSLVTILNPASGPLWRQTPAEEAGEYPVVGLP
ncbi:hypothetical protein [Streptomyces sp. IMTB 1903]|uniref:hypothetical protein n=1 Tax=Streptomyces sp. IMTB 1903 TaxID=1776680 RepID=UPI00075A3505|nr:hypothetical protein [Streptomyces sp. IMTB 1903]